MQNTQTLRKIMNNLIKKLTEDCPKCRNIGFLFLRIGMGLSLIINHGWDKIHGGVDRWAGIGETGMNHLGIEFMHTFFGFMAAFSESICAILVVIGLMTRPASFLIAVTMAVGVNFHISSGKGSPELALVYLFGMLALTIGGAGSYSLDSVLFKQKK